MNTSESPYDVIFSITMHEQPEAFQMTIQNIRNASSELRTGIAIHTNHAMFVPMQTILKDHEDVWVHPTPFDKGWAQYGILEGHLENIKYISTVLNKKTRYYCLLASNCMFHKKVDHSIIETAYAERVPAMLGKIKSSWYWYRAVFANKYVLKKLEDLQCPLVMTFHEGTLYESAFLETAADLVLSWNIKPHIVRDMPFEEYILQSLYAKETNFVPASICTLGTYTTIEDVKNTESVCIKPISRDPNNPIRKYLASLLF